MRGYLLSAALVLVASPALAADYFYTDPPPLYGYDQPNNWSGQYIGATLGGLRPSITIPGGALLEGNAFAGGVFAGVNYQDEGGIVFGAEADAEYSTFHQSADCDTAGWTCAANMNFQGSLRARLGYAFDSFHVYGTAGLAVAHLGGSTTNAGVEHAGSDFRYGWTAGVGAELAFSDAWFARAEYRYTDLGSSDMTFDTVYPGVKVTSHALRAGVGYRF